MCKLSHNIHYMWVQSASTVTDYHYTHRHRAYRPAGLTTCNFYFTTLRNGAGLHVHNLLSVCMFVYVMIRVCVHMCCVCIYMYIHVATTWSGPYPPSMSVQPNVHRSALGAPPSDSYILLLLNSIREGIRH